MINLFLLRQAELTISLFAHFACCSGCTTVARLNSINFSPAVGSELFSALVQFSSVQCKILRQKSEISAELFKNFCLLHLIIFA